MTVQAGLCRTWSETQIVGFLMHWLIFYSNWHDIGVSNRCIAMSSCRVATETFRKQSDHNYNMCTCMSRLVGKPTMWFPNRFDTNWAVHTQKMARG